MFEPNPQKLSIRNEDVVKYQNSFFFFAHLLRAQPHLPWLSKIIILFTYFQIFICTLTAPIIDHFISNKRNFLDNVYFIFLHYSKDSINFEHYKYLIFLQSIFLIVFSSFIFFMFFAFLHGYRIPLSLASLRGLLIILSPSNVVIAVVLHLSFAIRSISNENCSIINLTVAIVFSLAVLFAYFTIILWASPLVLKTPFLSIGHVPSPLLPDLIEFKLNIIYTIAMSASLASSTKRSLIFFICFSPIFGIFRFYSIWKYPYSSIFDTVFGLALSLSMISNPLLYLIPYCAHRMSDALYFGVMISIFAVFLIFSYIIFVSRQNNALNNIKADNFERISESKLLFYAQTALVYGQLSPNLVEHISEYYKIKPSNDLLIVYCYTFILTANKLEIDVLDQPLSALIQVKTLSWPKRFIVFELYRSFAQTMSLPVPIPRLSDVNNLTDKYWRKQNKFWEKQIDGDVNSGIKYLHKMNKIYMKSHFLFEKIRQFYKRHPRVVQIEANFFAQRRRRLHPELAATSSINYMTCDIQRMYSHFIKRQTVATMTYEKQRKDDAAGTTAATVNTTGTITNPLSVTDSVDNRTLTQISSNLHKFLERPLPLGFYFLGLLSFLLFAAVFTILVLPVFQIIDNADYLSMVPTAFNNMRQITLSYSNMNIAIKHLSDCTDFVAINCDEVFSQMGIPFIEPPWSECKTVHNIVSNLTNIAIQTQKWLESYSEIMEDFQSNKGLENLFRSWYVPIVPLFPETPSTDHSIINNVKLDLRTALVLYTSDIIKYDPTNDPNPSCETSYANYTRQDSSNFFNVSTTLQIDLIDSLQGFKSYICELKGEFTSKREVYVYIVTAILILFSIIIFDLMIYLRELHMYNVLKNHFRPNSNPYTDKVYDKMNEPQPFRFQWKRIIPTTACVLIIYFFFLLQFFFVYNVIIDSRDEIANECEAIIEIGNVTLHTSLEIVAYLRYFQNSTDPIIYDNLIETQNKLIDSITMMDIAISPLRIRRLWNREPLTVETDRCTHVGSHSNFSIHDVEACWPLSRQASVFFFYFLTFLNRTGHKDISSEVFLNAQHIYISHLMDDFALLASDFDHFSKITTCELMMLCMVEIGFYVVFLVIALIATIYFDLVEFSSLYQQINRIFKVLMPKFIASQQCLMSFIITENKESESKKEIPPSFFSFYDDADLAVVVISDRMMIVAFTHGVQTLFGYRAEQLIGQPLTILIPKTMSNNVSHNSTGFYQQLANIKKRQAEPVVTRDLLGRSSDGTEIQLHVKAMLSEVGDLDFFVIECKSLADLFFYDLLIQKHKDMFDQMISVSMPRSLFPEINNDQLYSAAHYDNFILLYITSPKSDSYSSLTVGMDLSEIKAKVESVIPYFNGSGGAIVLDMSCSHACILFVDYTGDVNQLFSDTWQFLNTYLSADLSTKAGILIKGGGEIPNIDMYYDSEQDMDGYMNNEEFNDKINNNDNINNNTDYNQNNNINENINNANANNNSNNNNNDNLINNMDLRGNIMYSDSQDGSENEFDDEDDDEYEPGVDIIMYPPPQVPPQFANIESPIEESKKFIPTMTLEPFSQVFAYLPQLIELVKPNEIIISQELCKFIDDAHFSEVVTDLPYKLASIDILTEPQLPTDTH